MLKSLSRSSIDRVYFIDQSADNSFNLEEDIKEYLASQNSKLQINYEILPNRGYGAGHNHAMKLALATWPEYHVIMNPNFSFEGNITEKMVSYMDAHRDVAQMMPMVRYSNGQIQYLCKQLPTPIDFLSRLLLPKWVQTSRKRRFEMCDSGYDHIMNVPYLSGCFMSFLLSAIREIGFFGEHFFMYAEDMDITRRLHEKYNTLFFPEVEIIHVHNQADRRSICLFWTHIVNIIRYFNK